MLETQEIYSEEKETGHPAGTKIKVTVSVTKNNPQGSPEKKIAGQTITIPIGKNT